ncbi:hypothetical protein DPMN_074365 [Dreissena polymorpha]|uniref:Uncharacterized protein n=1 Tax=Dreissena polymorpha TaxID=45954 RepID=A0A9D3YIB0_DREPO|nr:hypothetical protein DPMN_074365 [Dreissena polymorpha]
MVHKSVRLDAAKTSADDSEKQQRKLTDFAKPTMTRQKWIVCTEKLALMYARDLRPISIVNGEGFIDFCRELLKVLSMQTGVALTSDHWTSLATEGYITVTCHFIDEGKHTL